MGKDYWKIADGDYNEDGSVDFQDELDYDMDFFDIDADPIAMAEYENYLDDCEAEERRREKEQEEKEDLDKDDFWDTQEENLWEQDEEEDWYDRERREKAWRDEYIEEAEEYGLDIEDYDDEDDFLAELEAVKEEAEAAENSEDEEEDCEDYNGEEDSFNESTPKKSTEGAWKYYESFAGGWWEFAQALIDNFPELEEDYDTNSSNSTLRDIIRETYEIDKDRTVKYLRWLWKTFTPDIFSYEKEDGCDRESFKVRGELIQELIFENEGDEYLYKLLTTEEFIASAFKDCVHNKHEYYLAENYVEKMIRHKDVEGAKRAYAAYLEGQKGRYSNKDLGKMWDDIVNNIDWMDELATVEKVCIAKEFIPFIEILGERSKKPLQTLAKYQKEWKKTMAIEKEMAKEEAERAKEKEKKKKQETKTPTFVEKKMDKYAWRKKVSQAKGRWINPYDYETKEEYVEAVKTEVFRYETEKAQTRRARYSKDQICNFCKVDIPMMTNTILYYYTGDVALNVGDEVVVPFGGDNKECFGMVVAVGSCYASIFSFDIKQMKTVIKKVEK